MNRADRRRMARLQAHPGKMWRICAWRGCGQVFEGNFSGPPHLPPGWRYLIVTPVGVFDPRWINHSDRDTVLCPKHFQELDNLLIPLPGMDEGEFALIPLNEPPRN